MRRTPEGRTCDSRNFDWTRIALKYISEEHRVRCPTAFLALFVVTMSPFAVDRARDTLVRVRRFSL
jgi:hypothetical protein